MKLKEIYKLILEESEDYFKQFVKDAKNYPTPITPIWDKKGHALDNIPTETKTIKVNSTLFKKESSAWEDTGSGTISYHNRPSDDKYWNKNLESKMPPVLIDYEDNQLRVSDGNHRLNVYLSKGYNEIPCILSKKAKEYIGTLNV
tara:strand:+ start:1148 stop:1582 length:435 start_codon:yes stop_codon:yes gene_type:complete